MKNSKLSIFLKGLIAENPVLVLVLGILFGTGNPQNSLMSYIIFFGVVSVCMLLALLVFMLKVNEPKLVRQMQKDEFGGRYVATDLACPDFVLLARACGLAGVRVTGLDGLDAALRKAMRAKRPTLLEVTL